MVCERTSLGIEFPFFGQVIQKPFPLILSMIYSFYYVLGVFADMKLEVKDLYKNFGDKQVLQGVDFSVESGTALGLLGRNGAGKTTAIRIIMGVFGGEGEVLLDGKSINRREINFGYLPEERGLYPKKKISEQLTYFGMLRGMSKKNAKESVLSWLDRLEMTQYADARLDTLSKGNQQKIQLACALVTDPDIIILDEPFSGLDPVNAMLLKGVVAEVIKKGRILLFSSHMMNYVEEFCEKIAIMRDGKVVLEGKIKDIKRSTDRKKLVIASPEAPKLASAIGERLADYIACKEVQGDHVAVCLRAEGHKVKFISAMAALGIDFDGVQVFEPTLQDIFVKYTEV